MGARVLCSSLMTVLEREWGRGGLSQPSTILPFFQISVIPLNLVSKKLGGGRQIIDASRPDGSTENIFVGNVPIAPNNASRRGTTSDFEWLPITAIGQAAEALLEACEG